jgi:hypothetical protein
LCEAPASATLTRLRYQSVFDGLQKNTDSGAAIQITHLADTPTETQLTSTVHWQKASTKIALAVKNTDKARKGPKIS